MARNAGTVQNKHTAKNVRRKHVVSALVTVTQAAPLNLLIPLCTAPPSSRLAFESLTILNAAAISDHTAGTLAIGHSTSAGTFTADSIMVAANLPQNSGAKIATVKTAANFASTLKTGSKAIQNVKYPIVPSGATVWATSTAMAVSGTGTFYYIVRFWELDDENE